MSLFSQLFASSKTAKRFPVKRSSLKPQFDHLEERALMTVSSVMNPVSHLVSYSLEQGNLYESIVGGAKTVIDTNVKSFATATLGNANYLFDLNSNGLLKSTTGGDWSPQDTAVTSFAVATLAGENYIIDLNASAVLKSSTGGGWANIDTGVKSFSVGSLLGANYLFDLTSTGDLKETAGYGWSTQDTAVVSFATGSLGGTNYIFDLTNIGDLRASSGNGWTKESSEIHSFAFGKVGGTNYLLELNKDNTLYASSGSGWVPQDTNVLKFDLGSLNGTNYLWDLNTSGVLKASSGSGWVSEDAGVRAFALGSLNGVNYVFDLNNASVLKSTSGTGWVKQDTNVKSFAFTSLNGVDSIIDQSGTTLKGSSGNGWVTQGTGVESFAINSLGGVNYVCELTTSNSVKYNNGGSWNTYSANAVGPFGLLQTPITNPGQVSTKGALYTDIKQGSANTCWIDSSIAAMASKGVDLSKRITYQGNNWYTVSLFERKDFYHPEQGFQSKTVWVYFDGSRAAADMAFDPNQAGESWTVIMQRALIQIFGETDSGMTIASPHSGGAADVQPFLTGHASTTLSPTDSNITTEVMTVLKAGKYVVMHTQSSGTKTLVSGHAYTILSANSQNVTLYNPYGFSQTVSWNVIAQKKKSLKVN